MKEAAIYYPDNTSRTSDEVKRKLLLEESTAIRHLTDFPESRDFDAWTEIATRQQRERKELLEIPEHVHVEIDTKRPILIGLFGDVHAGAIEVDYERFAKDVKAIKEADGYSIAVGDLTDSYFFMPGAGEQILTGQEQLLYMQSALDELAEGGKLIAGFGGDHDLWPKDKGGAHTLYHQFNEHYNAHYLEEVSYVTIGLNNGENVVDYDFVGAHRRRGFSVYNDSHASLRQSKDEAPDSDISFTAHNHVKGYNQQVQKLHGGGEHLVHMLALGAYKASDRYSRKMGWARKDDVSMGGFGLVLHPSEKKIDVYWSLEEAVDSMV